MVHSAPDRPRPYASHDPTGRGAWPRCRWPAWSPQVGQARRPAAAGGRLWSCPPAWGRRSEVQPYGGPRQGRWLGEVGVEVGPAPRPGGRPGRRRGTSRGRTRLPQRELGRGDELAAGVGHLDAERAGRRRGAGARSHGRGRGRVTATAPMVAAPHASRLPRPPASSMSATPSTPGPVSPSLRRPGRRSCPTRSRVNTDEHRVSW